MPELLYYRLPEDWIVLVGRSDADNDRLSLKVARPNDWWFHVRGMPGSHVVLRAREHHEPARRTIEAAAALAAHHSKQRQAGVTGVSVTRARNVTKPRGVPRGTVEVRRESVVKVRPGIGEAERITREEAGEDV